ncbi:uncharacterized protein [Amphiura filiformis]|uniref:uncharacterized protein n=1 Tax=Amphiura filiformis TaxID=82378 RepID=UPI003B227E7B
MGYQDNYFYRLTKTGKTFFYGIVKMKTQVTIFVFIVLFILHGHANDDTDVPDQDKSNDKPSVIGLHAIIAGIKNVLNFGTHTDDSKQDDHDDDDDHDEDDDDDDDDDDDHDANT